MGFSKEQFTHERERLQYFEDRTYYNEVYGTITPRTHKHITGTDRSVVALKIADIENELEWQ